MPSSEPDRWRQDVERTRKELSKEKVLSVSVVGTVQEGWDVQRLAEDYAEVRSLGGGERSRLCRGKFFLSQRFNM